MKYKGIKNVNSCFSKVKTVKQKSLHFFACVCICLLMLSCYNVGLVESLGLKQFVIRVTNNWTPKPDDFGKIKFVNFSFNNNNSDGVFIVNSPFKNYYATNITQTQLQINGLGDVIVISPIDGFIQSITYEHNKYSLVIKNSNVMVNIGELDYVCIAEGSGVSAGEKIAVSLSSVITFSIVCSGEYVELPAGGIGDTFFE